ncbi:MAG TPA: hypothetical protein VIG77_03485 [Ktedonobacterales bacterium]|jgi:hypothetical protein
MRPSDDDPEVCSTPETETTQTTQTAEESDTSATAVGRAAAPLSQSAITAPTLRFLLHRDTPLWRFGH